MKKKSISSSKRGGARRGAGRKPIKNKVITKSISMRPEKWDLLELRRGKKSRGAYIASRLK